MLQETGVHKDASPKLLRQTCNFAEWGGGCKFQGGGEIPGGLISFGDGAKAPSVRGFHTVGAL